MLKVYRSMQSAINSSKQKWISAYHIFDRQIFLLHCAHTVEVYFFYFWGENRHVFNRIICYAYAQS